MDDEGAIRCMLDELRKVRYGAMSDAERRFCGLITMSYPITFER